MPDFFDGHPADISWYPPDTPEKGKKLGEFFAGPAAPPKTLERIPKVLEALGKEYPDIKAWVGFENDSRQPLTAHREFSATAGAERCVG
jgi:hypothetical protein